MASASVAPFSGSQGQRELPLESVAFLAVNTDPSLLLSESLRGGHCGLKTLTLSKESL